MTQDNFVVRTMTRAELDLAVEWAAREGWNPGLHDANAFHATDPAGFYLGLLDGEPIGCVSVVTYDATFAFLGLYIVRPEFRGRGYGLRIWNAALVGKESHNIGLDGVIAQQENYKKSGFRLAYRHVRFEFQGKTQSNASGPVDLTTIPLADVVAYDAALFPARRETFLANWIHLPQSRALGVLRAGKLVGYGVIRRCREGWKIGPLFADDDLIADGLFRSLVERTGDEPVYLDVPSGNLGALGLTQRYGMRPVFETARMYTRDAPTLPQDRIFGATSLELG